MTLSFIVIDDTELDQFIAKRMIGQAGKHFEVKSFYEARSAFEFIKSESELLSADMATLVLLDMYMPVMNGYDFLDAFETLDQKIQDRYYIVALTSSVDRTDNVRFRSYKSVKGVLCKPLSATDLTSVITRMIAEKGIVIP